MKNYEKLFRDAINDMNPKDVASFILALFDVANRDALQRDILSKVKLEKKKEVLPRM